MNSRSIDTRETPDDRSANAPINTQPRREVASSRKRLVLARLLADALAAPQDYVERWNVRRGAE